MARVADKLITQPNVAILHPHEAFSFLFSWPSFHISTSPQPDKKAGIEFHLDSNLKSRHPLSAHLSSTSRIYPRLGNLKRPSRILPKRRTVRVISYSKRSTPKMGIMIKQPRQPSKVKSQRNKKEKINKF